MVQTIEIYLEPGEGEKGAKILKALEIPDFNLIKSVSSDLLVVRHPLDKTDQIISKFNETFKFGTGGHRGIIISSPDVVLPKGEAKEKKLSERSAWETMIEYGEQHSSLSSKYLALFFFSAIVATLGLITDNVAVVVGAMIIAPAFGPIASASIGIVAGRMDLFRKGMKNELIGVALAIATAALLGFILPGVEMNESLRTRMYPTIIDLFVALAAGAAGGYVLVSGKSSSVVGVMVAAALIPVMASIGIGVVFLNPIPVLGAFLLLIVNVVSISLAMVIVFWLAGPKQKRKLSFEASEGKEKEDVAKMVGGLRERYDYRVRQLVIKRMVKYSVVLIVVLTIPLAWLTYEDLITKTPENEISTLFAQTDLQNVELDEINIEPDRIKVTMFTFGEYDAEGLQLLYSQVKRRIDSRYYLEFYTLQAAKGAN